MKELDKFCGANLSIGLFGGSFDPPHNGHLFIAQDALKRFKLDWVWWLVTPRNTLKAVQPSSLQERIKLCKRITCNESHMLVSNVESEFKFQDTIQLIEMLQEKCPNKYFWIMGSDTLPIFHKWPGWQDMLGRIKMIVYDRPGFLFETLKHKVNAELVAVQCSASELRRDKIASPAWALVRDQAPDVSSTQIRALRK